MRTGREICVPMASTDGGGDKGGETKARVAKLASWWSKDSEPVAPLDFADEAPKVRRR